MYFFPGCTYSCRGLYYMEGLFLTKDLPVCRFFLLSFVSVASRKLKIEWHIITQSQTWYHLGGSFSISRQLIHIDPLVAKFVVKPPCFKAGRLDPSGSRRRGAARSVEVIEPLTSLGFEYHHRLTFFC